MLNSDLYSKLITQVNRGNHYATTRVPDSSSLFRPTWPSKQSIPDGRQHSGPNEPDLSRRGVEPAETRKKKTTTTKKNDCCQPQRVNPRNWSGQCPWSATSKPKVLLPPGQHHPELLCRTPAKTV